MGPVEREKQRKLKKIPSPMIIPGMSNNSTTLSGNVENPEKTRHKREYYVNEKLISARVFSYVSAMKEPVLHMVTISFPTPGGKQIVSDDQGFQYLNNWLTVCRETLHLRDYLFVSEYQPTTGTIHFHIMVPQYFNIVKANKVMVTILCNQVRKGALKWNLQAAKRYNGVDLDKDRKTKKVINFGEPKKRRNLVAYITKYCSKGKKPREGEEAKKGFPHLAWHNSRGFSSMFTGVSLTKAESVSLGIRGMLNFAKIFISEYFSWLPWSANIPPGIFTGMLRTANQAILYNDKTDIHLKLKFAA